MLAAQLITDDTFHILTALAALLFAIAAVMALIERAYVLALAGAGLALFAFAWFAVS